MYLSENAKRVIRKLIFDSKTGEEDRVTALWNNILPKFNINLDNGYSINSEYPTKCGDKADIVVINILQYEKIIMVIECKSIKHDNRTGWDMAATQLYKYISDLECNKGIIAIGHKFRFVTKSDSFISDINSLVEYNWEDSFDDNFNDIYQNFNIFLENILY